VAARLKHGWARPEQQGKKEVLPEAGADYSANGCISLSGEQKTNGKGLAFSRSAAGSGFRMIVTYHSPPV